MASHHHHHHCHHPSTANPPSCYCQCCCPTYTPCHHHLPPPPPPPPDSHLRSLPQYPQHFQEHYLREETVPHPTISSLLRRIASLESALRRRSSHASPFQSLRDAAARTIQAHFRAFLLRRSVTLRQLKDLASIKSTLGILKSSVSEKTHFDYEVIYHKATNLLTKLDTIQGDDPMIKNGKSSLSRELNRFLDFLEGICVQRRAISIRNLRQIGNNVKPRFSNGDNRIGNVKSESLKRANVEKLRGLVERIDRLAEELEEEENEAIKNTNNDFMVRKLDVSTNRAGGLLKQHGGVEPKVKKNVTFAQNGKVYRVLRRRGEPSQEECSNDSIDRDDSVVDDENEPGDELCRGMEEIGVSSKEDVEEDGEEEDSLISSDGEKESRPYSTRHEGDDDDDGFIFSAPLPVKMEVRGDSFDKKKKLNNM